MRRSCEIRPVIPFPSKINVQMVKFPAVKTRRGAAHTEILLFSISGHGSGKHGTITNVNSHFYSFSNIVTGRTWSKATRSMDLSTVS